VRDESIIPLYGARFSFMNETWATIGWATKGNEVGEYIWCHSFDAEFVIGERRILDQHFKIGLHLYVRLDVPPERGTGNINGQILFAFKRAIVRSRMWGGVFASYQAGWNSSEPLRFSTRLNREKMNH
jgi:hypothetical protein